MLSKKIINEKYINKKIIAVDLFCGAGGLTCGLKKSGITVNLGIDIDPACAYPYSANNKAKFLLKSVENLTGHELQEAFDGADIKFLAGCAPCQTFSSYNQKANSTDKRWWLLLQFSRLIKETKVDIITMENVPGLIDEDVFKEFINTLEEEKFYVNYQIVNCAEYGLPQNRNRLVVLASKIGQINLISNKYFRRKKTVRDVISNLPFIQAGEIDLKDSLHQSSCLSKINDRRIRNSVPGGTWKDWSTELITECHKRKSGKTYLSVYGRMCWDKPAPTITTQFYGFGNGRFGHPEQNRAISLREGAILQSFPKSYKFNAPNEPIKKKVIGRLIGNAVPVRLGEVIGRSILHHLEQEGIYVKRI